MLIPKKYQFHVVSMIAVAAIVLYPLLGNKIDPQILHESTVAAEDFMALVDAGDYQAARQNASTLLQEKVAVEVWHRQIGVMRDRVGPLKERKQDKASFSTYASDAPDGEYVTLEYLSDFEKKSQALETVNLMREEDGRWRVVGYFIK